MSWESIKAFFASLTLERLLPTVLILVIGILVVKLILKFFFRALSRSRLEQTLVGFLRRVMRILLYSLVILIAAGSLGVDVTSLVAILSVVSLAISLAVQNTLTNVVGSVTLLATHPFRVGDFVQIGAESGNVAEIGMNYTLLQTADGKQIYIPNSDVASSRIYNFTAQKKRRIDLTFSAAYAADTETVKAAIRKAAVHPKMLEGTEPVVVVSELADSSVNYLLQLWVAPEDYLPVRAELTERVKREFDAQHIEIPFPQVDVHMNQ